VLHPTSRQTISLVHGHACCQGCGRARPTCGFPRSQSAPRRHFSHAARCHTRTARSPTSSHQASLVFRPEMSAIPAPECRHECRHLTSFAAAAHLGPSCELPAQGCVAAQWAMTTTCMSPAGPVRIGSKVRCQDRCELPHTYIQVSRYSSVTRPANARPPSNTTGF
jgi:hypothetical protein